MPEKPNALVNPPKPKDLAARSHAKFEPLKAHSVQMSWAQGFHQLFVFHCACFSLGCHATSIRLFSLHDKNQQTD